MNRKDNSTYATFRTNYLRGREECVSELEERLQKLTSIKDKLKEVIQNVRETSEKRYSLIYNDATLRDYIVSNFTKIIYECGNTLLHIAARAEFKDIFKFDRYEEIKDMRNDQNQHFIDLAKENGEFWLEYSKLSSTSINKPANDDEELLNGEKVEKLSEENDLDQSLDDNTVNTVTNDGKMLVDALEEDRHEEICNSVDIEQKPPLNIDESENHDDFVKKTLSLPKKAYHDLKELLRRLNEDDQEKKEFLRLLNEDDQELKELLRPLIKNGKLKELLRHLDEDDQEPEDLLRLLNETAQEPEESRILMNEDEQAIEELFTILNENCNPNSGLPVSCKSTDEDVTIDKEIPNEHEYIQSSSKPTPDPTPLSHKTKEQCKEEVKSIIENKNMTADEKLGMILNDDDLSRCLHENFCEFIYEGGDTLLHISAKSDFGDIFNFGGGRQILHKKNNAGQECIDFAPEGGVFWQEFMSLDHIDIGLEHDAASNVDFGSLE